MTIFILTGALLIQSPEPNIYLYAPIIFQSAEKCQQARSKAEKDHGENYYGKCTEGDL